MGMKISKIVNEKLKEERRRNNSMGRKDDIYFDKGNGQWGYVINFDFGDVVEYMEVNNLNSLIDLGAGEGHPIEIMNDLGFNAKGYEIEDSLINSYHGIFGRDNIEKKDILTLVVEDIKDFDVIYMWQPLKDDNLLKQFFTNLFNIIQPNQTIIFLKDSPKYYRKNKKLYLEQFTDKPIEKYYDLEIFKN